MAKVEADTPFVLYGTDAAPAPVRRFAVGRLAFELVGGNLRAIRVDGVELIRAIQYLVRDRDWGTLKPEIHSLHVQQSDDLIEIYYGAECTSPDGERLAYGATIAVFGDRLIFSVEAQALTAVTLNRLGFCVLHPAGLAGLPLRVEHGDGSVEESVFPERIDPWQPFTDIAGLIHRQGDVAISCRLDGDTFEMEDQRNWSDAGRTRSAPRSPSRSTISRCGWRLQAVSRRGQRKRRSSPSRSATRSTRCRGSDWSSRPARRRRYRRNGPRCSTAAYRICC